MYRPRKCIYDWELCYTDIDDYFNPKFAIHLHLDILSLVLDIIPSVIFGIYFAVDNN